MSILLEKANFTSSQMARLLNVSRKTVFLKLKKLKEDGLIVREGSARKGSWLVVKEKAYSFLSS